MLCIVFGWILSAYIQCFEQKLFLVLGGFTLVAKGLKKEILIFLTKRCTSVNSTSGLIHMNQFTLIYVILSYKQLGGINIQFPNNYSYLEEWVSKVF